MRISTTDGKEYWYPDFCPYCSLDTAGNHEANCPNRNVVYYQETAKSDNYFEILLGDIHSVVKGRLKNWKENEHRAEKFLLTDKVN